MIALKRENEKVPFFLNWRDIDKMKLIQLMTELYNSYLKNNFMTTLFFLCCFIIRTQVPYFDKVRIFSVCYGI